MSSSGLTRARCRLAGESELALTHHGVDARDVVLDRLQALVVVERSGGRMEAQVEQLFLCLPQLQDELVVEQPAQLHRSLCWHQPSPASRFTMLHFIGSLWIARVSASLAVASFG